MVCNMTTHQIEDLNYFYASVPTKPIEIDEEEKSRILKEYPAPSFPDSEESFDILNMNHGDKVKDALLLLNGDYQIRPTANQKRFLLVGASNSQSSFKAKAWDNRGEVDRFIPLIEKHSVFKVSGKIEQYPRETGPKSLVIEDLEPVLEDIDATSLIPSTSRNIESMTVELYTYMDSLSEPHRTVALTGMKRHWNEFVLAPAAKGNHHNYLGGLLKHTLGLVRLGVYLTRTAENPYKGMLTLINIAEKAHKRQLLENLESETMDDYKKMVWSGSFDYLYSLFDSFSRLREEEANLDLFISSIFYHDLPKYIEYSYAGEKQEKFKDLFPTVNTSSEKNRRTAGIAMDPIGKLMGHIPMGAMMFSKVIEEEGIELTIEEMAKYQHNILAHHGKREWGSAIDMMTPEAHLIAFVDYLDSRWENSDEIK